MSNSPHAFFVFRPTGWGSYLVLSSYQPMSSRRPVPAYGPVLPPRQAYSHSASVGNRMPAFWQNSTQSSHETCSTGRSSPLCSEGLFPITLLHCACVTSVRANQKPFVSVT